MCKGVTIVAAVVLACVSGVSADTFGMDDNEFEIFFVSISADTYPVSNDYRMGTFEITNDQWSKFESSLGVPVTGDPSYAYDSSPFYTSTNVPSNNVSWYEAAQFVNWLNTSTGHQAAYKFTGTQGTSGYALDIWSEAEADNGTNLYRHKDAFYYMPTVGEWVKAAYWNGTSIQSHATKPGDTLHQGDGTSGTGWNYYDNGWATDPSGPWDVGSGSEELNGTFDMMGNVEEWMENPWTDPSYGTDSFRGMRGGSYRDDGDDIGCFGVGRLVDPKGEARFIGFRVASEVPEPCTLGLLSLGCIMALRRRR